MVRLADLNIGGGTGVIGFLVIVCLIFGAIYLVRNM